MNKKLAILLILCTPQVLCASVDVGKGTDVIPPDSDEAAALHHSDKAWKNAPKDQTYTEDLVDGGTYQKSGPKLNNQKIDVPDTETLRVEGEDEIAVTTDDDHPVVLNEYDPNNLGSKSDKASGPKIESLKSDSKDSKKGSSLVKGSGSNGNSDKGSSTTGDYATSTSSANNPSTSLFPHYSYAEFLDSLHDIDSPLHSFILTSSMIIISEIGDKTFLLAALLAMKHPRVTVFTAAFSSLAVMSILSAVLGHTLPSLLSPETTNLLAAVLFLVFGIKLLREGLQLDKSSGVEDEILEVEEEIYEKERTDLEAGLGEKVNREKINALKRSDSAPRLSQDGLENGTVDDLYKFRPKRSQMGSAKAAFRSTTKQLTEGVGNLASLVLSPVWVQTFVMTFLAEWGDRSQVATIALGAGSDYSYVILGSIFGHFLCTLSAVMGGKFLASKISLRTVTLGGAVTFLLFAVLYFMQARHLY